MQFTNFERRSLKFLRIYMKQPSPNWNDFNLRDIQVFMKKTDRQLAATGSTSSFYQQSNQESKSQQNPFDSFKSALKRNFKSLRKDQDQNQTGISFVAQFGDPQTSQLDADEYATMQRYYWTQEVPSYLYHEDVRKVDLYYNII